MIDRLGDYSCEFKSAQEIVGFFEQDCVMRCVKAIPVGDPVCGNNQFVFERLHLTPQRES